MSKTKNSTQDAKLEIYRVALTNAKSNPIIMEILSQHGLSSEIIEQGSNLLTKAWEESKSAELKRSVLSESYKGYSKLMASIEERFLSDRKIAQMGFIYDAIAQEKLNLNKRYPGDYVKKIGMIRSFYTVLSENQVLAEQLAKYGQSTDNVNSMLSSILEMEQLRANYINEKGMSQNATNTKKKAFKQLKNVDDPILFHCKKFIKARTSVDGILKRSCKRLNKLKYEFNPKIRQNTAKEVFLQGSMATRYRY